VSPKPELTPDECRKIYASQYDSRNVMEERFWSGQDLVTTSVHSRVMLDPGHRLSYTEKVLTVAQTTVGNAGITATQEAIYTFFLPEGGAVTALSLWIEGKEEPGILTAKSKAKEAYTTIVGRERRDPAVVFWQEGNQVRVRVFPVTREMPRQFKIGVTAPLHIDNQTLVYDNVSFDGPSALLATERDSVFFEGNGVFSDAPVFFKNEQSGALLTFDGVYRHKWSVACAAPPLSRSVFSFDGKTYVVAPWREQNETFRPTHIYLDLNAAWTPEDLKMIRSLAHQRTVSVATPDGFETLTEQNATRLLWQAQRLRFSLFPFYKIDTPEESMVVTKSAGPTPLPSELEGSAFGDALQKWTGGPLRVFHIGDDNEISAYLRTLRERRDIFCVSGDFDLLKRYLESDSYAKNPENAHTVALPESRVLIMEKDTVVNGKAPDHLFRLFAYNTVLRELHGRAGEEPDDLVRLAEQAYVVTPVTSLVTLETKADYERFDIKPTEGLASVGNAWTSGAGAVPEPHEWALLALLTLGAWLAWRRKFVI
ncbi:MAG TPA: XrtN system VIT domain-containing protein, partial [Saprospiraceae bacterium]|nr:XrtN system VIT domain-containing protein [Saprospiraceae bacterium]